MKREAARRRQMQRTRRDRASVLVAALIGTLVLGLLGVALTDRAVRSTATAGWGKDHLVLKLLAESAIDELGHEIARQANEPGTAVFTLLRTGRTASGATVAPGATAGDVRLPRLELAHVAAQVASHGQDLGGTIELRTAAVARLLARGRSDPVERSGLIFLEAAARLTRGARGTAASPVERVRVARSFRVARVAPVRPLDQVALMIVKTTKGDLKNFKGKPAYFLGHDASRNLVDLMSSKPPVGFASVPSGAVRTVRRAAALMSPEILARKAHYVVGSSGEMAQLLRQTLRAGGALNGIVHLRSEEYVRLAFTSFRGRCLISVVGPVEVGDIKLADPTRDSLTIVSGRRILITGRSIEANLVSPSRAKDALVFGQRAQIRGTVVAGRFPRAAGISVLDFRNCLFEASPAAAQPSGRSDEQLDRYVVGLSPNTVAVQHARAAEGWGEW
jgi:hypothetical protein